MSTSKHRIFNYGEIQKFVESYNNEDTRNFNSEVNKKLFRR